MNKSKPKTKTLAKKAAAKPAKKTFSAKAKNFGKQTRRPPNNPDMPQEYVEEITRQFEEIKTELDEYAAHLRALDRKRLNDVGIKRQGFIQRAYEYAVTNPEFLPHYLTLEKFREDDEYFIAFRNLFDTCKQIQEILWNITVQSADIVYTDALEFYASVREAAKRRVDAAETIHKDLEVFFKHRRAIGEEPTERQTLRDANALLRGKRDGKIVIENVKPKLVGGKHKVIDERFNSSAQFKESKEGEING